MNSLTPPPNNVKHYGCVSGQSHLIFGTGSTCCVITSWVSKLCCINALYKALENLDAIALGCVSIHSSIIRNNSYNLSATALGLYVCLKDICDEQGECNYSLRELAQEIGSSPSTIARHIPELVNAGLITAEKNPNGRGPANWCIRMVPIWEVVK